MPLARKMMLPTIILLLAWGFWNSEDFLKLSAGVALFIGEHLYAEVRELLASYQQGLQANGVDDVSYEQSLLDFRLALLLRQLKLIERPVRAPSPFSNARICARSPAPQERA